jgi:hypothetical protein
MSKTMPSNRASGRSFRRGSDDPHPGKMKYAKSGGAYRDRTDDLMLAKQPLSQLS